MIFRNTEQNDLFIKYGYIRNNFLNSVELLYLHDVFNKYNQINGSVIDFAKDLGYYISVFDSNLEKR